MAFLPGVNEIPFTGIWKMILSARVTANSMAEIREVLQVANMLMKLEERERVMSVDAP